MSGFIDLAWRLGSFRGSSILPYTLNFAVRGFDAAWIAPNWTVSGGTAKNTPSEGDNAVSNPEFTTDTTGWNTNNASVSRVDSATDPGVASGGVDSWAGKVVDGGAGAGIQQIITTVVGTWYRATCLGYAPSANSAVNTHGITFRMTVAGTGENTWQTLQLTNLAVAASTIFALSVNGGANGDVSYYDAAVLVPLSGLIADRDFGRADVSIKAAWTIANGYQAGGVARMNPAGTNYLLFYHDKTNCVLVKYVGTTRAVLISAVAAYVAGANVEIRCTGSIVQLFYNNTQVGTDKVVEDVEITNTRHGLFSTNVANLCSRIDVAPT